MAFQDHDRLLRHSLLLLVATLIGSIAAVLYQIFLIRRLVPKPAEYGIVAAMFGLIVIMATPLEALRTAVAHYAARYCQAGSPDRIRGLVGGWSRIMAGVAIAIIVGSWVGRDYLARFFQLPSPSILVLAGFVMAGTLFMPLLAGALQGMQAFGWWAVSGQSWGVVRLLAGIGLVLGIQASAMMGLLGQGIGVLASITLGGIGLYLALRGKPSGDTEILTGGGAYFVKSLLVLSGYAMLAYADICIVKHYFSPDEAGGFARAATIARGIIFLAMPIAGAMFPKVVSEGIVSERDRRTLIRALGYAVVLILAACIGCSFLARPILFVFVGQWPDDDSLRLLRMILWAMSPLGLTYLLLNFELAQRRFYWPWMIILCAIGYIGGVILWHQSVWQVVTVMGVVNLASLGVLGVGMPWKVTIRVQNGTRIQPS